jgi:hypothetical protein
MATDQRSSTRCPGTTYRGTPCRRKPGYGTNHPGEGHCVDHDGTRRGIQAQPYSLGEPQAAGRQFLERASFYGQPLDISPTEALLGEVRRSAGIVQWLGEKLGMLEDRLPQMSQVHEFEKGGTVYATDEAEWLRLYLAERQHLARVAKLAIDAGVAQEQVRLARTQASLVVMAIRTVLERLGLDESQQGLVPQVVPQVLRQLATTGPAVPPLEDPAGAARSRKTPRSARERA